MRYTFDFTDTELRQLREIAHREKFGDGRRNKITRGGILYSPNYECSIYSKIDGIPFVFVTTTTHAIRRCNDRLGIYNIRDFLGLISDVIQESVPLQDFILNSAEEREVSINIRSKGFCFFGSVEADCIRVDTVVETDGKAFILSDPQDARADVQNNTHMLSGAAATVFKDKIPKEKMVRVRAIVIE